MEWNGMGTEGGTPAWPSVTTAHQPHPSSSPCSLNTKRAACHQYSQTSPLEQKPPSPKSLKYSTRSLLKKGPCSYIQPPSVLPGPIIRPPSPMKAMVPKPDHNKLIFLPLIIHAIYSYHGISVLCYLL